MRSPVLDRVRKLLALATSSNPHEAAAAASRAQALIEAHRLQGWLDADQAADDHPDPITDGRHVPLETAKRPRKWRIVLAMALADANGCVAYSLRQGGETSLVLIGRQRDRDTVADLWGWLVKRIEWLSATHGAGRSKKWHEAFRIGVVSMVSERLSEGLDDARDALEPGALVRVNPARLAHQRALERFVEEHLSLGRGRAIRFDGAAWSAGRAAAGELELPTGDS